MRSKFSLRRLLSGADPSAPQQVSRVKSILLLAAILLVLLVLAAGISGLQLAPAERFPAELFAMPTSPPGQTLPGGEFMLSFARIALMVMLVLTPIYVIYALINRKRRRELLTNLIIVGMLMFLLSSVSQCSSTARDPEETTPPTITEEQPEELGTLEELPAFDPNAPDWLVLITTAVLALAVVATVALVIWLGFVRRRRPPAALEQMAQQAQQAAADLEAGGEFKEIIIRCYRDMSRVLQLERGIRRDSAMTPREFVDILRSKGLPEEPVRQLTLAFEAVRYGHASASEQQERAAVDNLRAIVDACRAMGGAQ